MALSAALLALGFGLVRQAGAQPGPAQTDRVDCPRATTVPMVPGELKAPLLRVEIQGRSYVFALDTGAAVGIIDPAVAAELGLKPAGQARLSDPSDKNGREEAVFKVPEAKVGGLELRGLVLLGQAGLAPKGAPGHIDGVLAYGVFRDVLLTIDYPAQTVTFAPGEMSAPQALGAISYRLDHGLPSVRIEIGSVSVDGHLDTGADTGVRIPSKFESGLRLDGPLEKVGYARTLFNSVELFQAKVKDPIMIGGLALPVDTVELDALLPMGNVGWAALHTFRVTIDQRQQKILLETP